MLRWIYRNAKIRKTVYIHTKHEKPRLLALAIAGIYVGLIEILTFGKYTSELRINLIMSEWMD